MTFDFDQFMADREVERGAIADPFLAQSLAAANLRPGIDYEPAVCDVCGEDEHTDEQLAECIDSAIGPGRDDRYFDHDDPEQERIERKQEQYREDPDYFAP